MNKEEVKEGISHLKWLLDSGILASEDEPHIKTVLDYIADLEKENTNAKYQYDLGYKACEIEFTNKIRDKIEEIQNRNYNDYTREQDGNEVKYSILNEFKELLEEGD